MLAGLKFRTSPASKLASLSWIVVGLDKGYPKLHSSRAVSRYMGSQGILAHGRPLETHCPTKSLFTPLQRILTKIIFKLKKTLASMRWIMGMFWRRKTLGAEMWCRDWKQLLKTLLIQVNSEFTIFLKLGHCGFIKYRMCTLVTFVTSAYQMMWAWDWIWIGKAQHISLFKNPKSWCMKTHSPQCKLAFTDHTQKIDFFWFELRAEY